MIDRLAANITGVRVRIAQNDSRRTSQGRDSRTRQMPLKALSMVASSNTAVTTSPTSPTEVSRPALATKRSRYSCTAVPTCGTRLSKISAWALASMSRKAGNALITPMAMVINGTSANREV